MTTLTRTAGAAGSIPFTTKNSAGQLVTPTSAPTAAWYTDTGRTLGVVALTVTGAGSSYTASWLAGDAPSTPVTRYLKFTIPVSATVTDTDTDDDVSFVDAVVSVAGTDYTTTAILKVSLGIESDDTSEDAALGRAITAASRCIDRYTGTAFYPTTEARYFSPDSPCEVEVDAFADATGLVVQVGTGGTWPTTVPAAQVNPWPYNAARRNNAFCRLLISANVLPVGYPEPTVKVTAVWGYAAIPEDIAQAALIKAARLYRRKDTPDGVAGSGEFGVVRISKYEDPDVILLLAPFTPVGAG